MLVYFKSVIQSIQFILHTFAVFGTELMINWVFKRFTIHALSPTKMTWIALKWTLKTSFWSQVHFLQSFHVHMNLYIFIERGKFLRILIKYCFALHSPAIAAIIIDWLCMLQAFMNLNSISTLTWALMIITSVNDNLSWNQVMLKREQLYVWLLTLTNIVNAFFMH